MKYEITYRYIKERWLDAKIIWARNEMDAQILFWKFVRDFRDINNVEFVRIDEKPE